MELQFTPRAAREVLEIMAQRGGNMALRIQVRQGPANARWQMRLEPLSAEAVWCSGVPVLADAATWRVLDGLVLDWTQTPEGPGFGVFSSGMGAQESAAP